MSFCVSCGSDVTQQEEYCPNCGIKLTDENVTTKGQIGQTQERTIQQVKEKTDDQPSIHRPIRQARKAEIVRDESTGQGHWDYIEQFRGKTTLAERLKKAYGKTLWFVLVMMGYTIFGFFVMMIGLMFGHQSGSYEITVIASILSASFVIFGYFAAFLFAATRGDYRTQLGFFEALGQSFRLIGELALVPIVGGLFLLIGLNFTESFGPIFIVLGGITIWLFPIAAQFYVVDYIVERKKEI
ncbi:MAG: hypothetical protein ACTSYA_13420 [Candidatus Kariarchaeaceae archaeon]